MSEDRSSNPNQKSWLEKLFSALSGDNDEPSSRDELMTFLRHTAGKLKLDQDAIMIIEGALEISDQQVREILIPRSQVSAITLDQTWDDYLPLIQETGHSRYPVVGENLDDVKASCWSKTCCRYCRNRKRAAMRSSWKTCCALPCLFLSQSV
ncbi:hypothetical protein HAALTHF_46550n [Vreelandella aquamarina]|nr:hypothetical protein HAALTHF_46550n [Halomonas axialensis]